MNLGETIREIVGNQRIYSQVCTVKSVNETANTCVCVPVNGDLDLYDVRLQSNIELVEGIQIYPKVNSFVIVSLLEKNDAIIIMFSEIEKIKIKTGQSDIEINSTKMIMNGGAFGGLVKINHLVQQLNKIESDNNTLKNIFSSWTTAPNDGGAALKALISAGWSNNLTPTTNQDIENEKITHG